MPYLIVRESYINSSCLVDGLPLNEIRLITEKSSSPSDLRDERNRRVEFATPACNLLNALEQIGYKVITSSSFVTGPKKFDTKDYIWTLYRPSCEARHQQGTRPCPTDTNEVKIKKSGRMPYVSVRENAVKWCKLANTHLS